MRFVVVFGRRMLATPDFDNFNDVRVVCSISKRFVVERAWSTFEFRIMFILRVGVDVMVNIALISIV